MTTETMIMIVLALFQFLIMVVVGAGIPWAMNVTKQLAVLQTMVAVYDQQHRKAGSDVMHLENRVEALTHRIDRCPICNETSAEREAEEDRVSDRIQRATERVLDRASKATEGTME